MTEGSLPPHLLITIHGVGPAVWILGHKRQEVVGEFYRWEAMHAAIETIRATTGQRSARSGNGELTHFAWILSEPANPHDSTAVAVYIGSTHVGYLPRAAGKYWTPIIAELEGTYRARVACMLRVGAKSDDGIHSLWLMLTTSINKARNRAGGPHGFG